MLKKSKAKSLRNVYKEIVQEISHKPCLVADGNFYKLMKTNPFTLKEGPSVIYSFQMTPKPIRKHIREEKNFVRSFSPQKRKSLRVPTPKSSKNQNLLDMIFERSSKQLMAVPLLEQTSQDLKDDYTLPHLGVKLEEKLADYRNRYDKMFRGKMSKGHLKRLI